MIAPSAEEILAIKAEARKRFGSDRVARVALGAPFDLVVCLAPLSLASAAEYDDAGKVNAENARSAMLVERVLFPSQEKLDEIRSAPSTAALDALVDKQFCGLMGFGHDGGDVLAAPLSALNAPPGFASPKEVAAKVAALIAAHPGSTPWSIYHGGSGLSCILRQPISDVWATIAHKLSTVIKSGRGSLVAALPFARDLCVWAPGLAGNAGSALEAHVDECPGRGALLVTPLLAMGGAMAETQASFL